MCIRNDIEVHSEDAADNRCRRQQTGHNRHYLHYFVQPQVYVAHIEVLQTHHYIPVVFDEIKSLDDVVVNVFEIL